MANTAKDFADHFERVLKEMQPHTDAVMKAKTPKQKAKAAADADAALAKIRSRRRR